MVDKITSVVKSGQANFKTVKVLTQNSLSNIKKQSKMIADLFGTNKKQKKNMNKLDKFFNKLVKMLKDKGFYGKTAYVSSAQEDFIKSLGFKVLGTFRLDGLNHNKINEVAELKPDFIIDNFHSKCGEPLAEVSEDSKFVVLLNFPGLFETKTLYDVLEYNYEQFKKIGDKE